MKAVHRTDYAIRGRGWNLSRPDLSGAVINQNDVRKRAAYVNTDAIHTLFNLRTKIPSLILGSGSPLVKPAAPRFALG